MFSAIFDVGVGLIVLYIVLAAMASGASESLNNALQTRGKMLRDFIAGLLVNSPMTVQQFYNDTLIAPHTQNGRPPAYIEAVDFVEALFSLLRQHSPTQSASGGVEMTIDEVKNVITQLHDAAPIKQVLVSVIAKASTDPGLKLIEDDVSKTKAALEQWYNNSMPRVTDRFKRRTQFILVVIGVIVAFGFNVDTLSVTNTLLQSPALRNEIQSQATQASSLSDASLQQLNDELKQLNLPIGWPDPVLGSTTPTTFQLLLKVIGLLITVFAISQGAPFWFDMLNRLTNLRSSTKPETPPVPPPATSPSLPAGMVPAVPVTPAAPEAPPAPGAPTMPSPSNFPAALG